MYTHVHVRVNNTISSTVIYDDIESKVIMIDGLILIVDNILCCEMKGILSEVITEYRETIKIDSSTVTYLSQMIKTKTEIHSVHAIFIESESVNSWKYYDVLTYATLSATEHMDYVFLKFLRNYYAGLV